MMNCRQASELCSDAMDRSLRLGEKMALRTHLLMCSGCANYRDQINLMRRVMHACAEGEMPADEPPAASTD